MNPKLQLILSAIGLTIGLVFCGYAVYIFWYKMPEFAGFFTFLGCVDAFILLSVILKLRGV